MQQLLSSELFPVRMLTLQKWWWGTNKFTLVCGTNTRVLSHFSWHLCPMLDSISRAPACNCFFFCTWEMVKRDFSIRIFPRSDKVLPVTLTNVFSKQKEFSILLIKSVIFFCILMDCVQYGLFKTDGDESHLMLNVSANEGGSTGFTCVWQSLLKSNLNVS